MQPSWVVIIPPLLVLISAYITRKLPLSLFIGLISGALIATSFSPFGSSSLLFNRLYGQISDTENLYVYIFLLCVGVLITIINYTGAAQAFAQMLQKRIRTAKTVESSSFFLSLILALDDYLNSLTVGYVMRPLTDKFSIARTKLAYVVHSFAGPLVILIPISTWGAFITSQLDQSGISAIPEETVKIVADPFYVYLQSIPFIFYALLTIFSAWFIIQFSISYGPMRKFEQAARLASSETAATESLEQPPETQHADLIDLLLPLITLMATVIVGMLYTGDSFLFGGSHTILEAFKDNAYSFHVLGISSMITVVVTLLLGYIRNHIEPGSMPSIVWNGIILMWPAVLLVILASTLGKMLRIDLHVGAYLASLLLKNISVMFLPLLFFIVGVITSTLIGTAWGTIALLLPIGIPMTYTLAAIQTPTTLHDLPMLIPTIGAILSGATFGDHTSPIAAAGIMAATSSGCKPLDHIQTQYPYALPVLVGSCAAYTALGLLTGYAPSLILFISLATGASVSVSLITLLNYI